MKIGGGSARPALRYPYATRAFRKTTFGRGSLWQVGMETTVARWVVLFLPRRAALAGLRYLRAVRRREIVTARSPNATDVPTRGSPRPPPSKSFRREIYVQVICVRRPWRRRTGCAQIAQHPSNWWHITSDAIALDCL